MTLSFWKNLGWKHMVYDKCSRYTAGAHSFLFTDVMHTPDCVFKCFFPPYSDSLCLSLFSLLFVYEKPPGVEQQVHTNYTPDALDLSLQNQCSLAASLFCAIPVIFQSNLNDHLEGARRISITFCTMKPLWGDHNCFFNTSTQWLNVMKQLQFFKKQVNVMLPLPTAIEAYS